MDDPDDNVEDMWKDKGTYTETEFLNLKPFDTSMLFTVLEETVVAQNNKIAKYK